MEFVIYFFAAVIGLFLGGMFLVFAGVIFGGVLFVLAAIFAPVIDFFRGKA